VPTTDAGIRCDALSRLFTAKLMHCTGQRRSCKTCRRSLHAVLQQLMPRLKG
jgi:hypothetical protein